MTRVILASGSRSRRAILEGAGVSCEVIRPRVDEEDLKSGLRHLDPSALALALARAKSLSLDEPGALVIGADQVMEFAGRTHDKPSSRAELRDRLARMAGRPHHLRGGVVISRNGDVVAEITASSTLTMRELSQDAIDSYLGAIDDTVALGTVGGYALEGTGARLFSGVDGDFFAILGLPLFPVLDVLRREGAIPW